MPRFHTSNPTDFADSFVEGKEQTATIQEIGGVHSVQSFKVLLDWLYSGEINCGIQGSAPKASALIQFACLAEMYDIGKVEAQIMGGRKTPFGSDLQFCVVSDSVGLADDLSNEC
ncbi:unnamed protein product [Penicillium glandicola]